MTSPPREQASERGKERAISRPQQRSRLLPAEHGQLMAQHQQLDVFGELTAPAPDQQAQHSRKGEIGERKQHAPMLSSPAPRQHARTALPGRAAANRLRGPRRSDIRARA
jgi:hypothetical protein